LDFRSNFCPAISILCLNLKIITPKDSESIIRQALLLGWKPDEKGNPVKYDLIDEKLAEREKPLLARRNDSRPYCSQRC
jgi:hypothetical protein